MRSSRGGFEGLKLESEGETFRVRAALSSVPKNSAGQKQWCPDPHRASPNAATWGCCGGAFLFVILQKRPKRNPAGPGEEVHFPLTAHIALPNSRTPQHCQLWGKHPCYAAHRAPSQAQRSRAWVCLARGGHDAFRTPSCRETAPGRGVAAPWRLAAEGTRGWRPPRAAPRLSRMATYIWRHGRGRDAPGALDFISSPQLCARPWGERFFSQWSLIEAPSPGWCFVSAQR